VVDKIYAIFLLEVRFQFEDFVPVFTNVHLNAVSHCNVIPPKKISERPPLKTPLIIVKNSIFRSEFFFVIETKGEKLQMRVTPSMLRILQWQYVPPLVFFQLFQSWQK
jgi:hypothetical protein